MQGNQCPIYNGTLELVSQYKKKRDGGGGLVLAEETSVGIGLKVSFYLLYPEKG